MYFLSILTVITVIFQVSKLDEISNVSNLDKTNIKDLDSDQQNSRVKTNDQENAPTLLNPFYSLSPFYANPFIYHSVPSNTYYSPNTVLKHGPILPSVSQAARDDQKFSYSKSPFLAVNKLSVFISPLNINRNQSIGANKLPNPELSSTNNSTTDSLSNPLLLKIENQNHQQQNLCSTAKCKRGYTCVLKKKIPCFGYGCPLVPVCVNPCNHVHCPNDKVCQVEEGACPPPYCDPVAVCKNLCEDVKCLNNEKCTTVYIPCQDPPCDVVPICGRDPCIDYQCPIRQGCYLQTVCQGTFCSVEPVCKNPCGYVTCPQDEYCYPEEVVCIQAPCNPIPVCKNPCAYASCPPGYFCAVDTDTYCIQSTDPCPPVAFCYPFKSKIDNDNSTISKIN